MIRYFIYFLGICFILALFPMSSQAQTLDDTQKVDWSIAGLQQLYVPEYQINVKDFGAKGDGLSDDSEAFLKAINAAKKKKGAEIIIPSGNFLIKQKLTLSSNTVLNGAGATKTKLLFDSGSKSFHCIAARGKKAQDFVRLTAAPQKGEHKIQLTAPIADLQAGDYIELRQENGNWDVKPRDWADFSVGQILKISKVNGKIIHTEHPLRISYNLSLNPEVSKFKPVVNVGIQNLAIERLNQPSKGLNLNILLKYAVNAWVKGVEGVKSVGAHVYVEASSNIEISGCYFHHAFDYSGSGTKGYGVVLLKHTGKTLVENNIFRHLRHSMMVKQGANGNVFAYNYSTEPNRSEMISNYSGDISMHGHYPFANLFEGNVVDNIICDQYWGRSGPNNTLFRNRVNLYGIIYSPNSSEGSNVIANHITNRSFLMGKLVLNNHDSHLVKENRIKKKTVNSIPETSFYYSGKPHFWVPNLIFPAVSSTNQNGNIPALERTKGNGPWTVFVQ